MRRKLILGAIAFIGLTANSGCLINQYSSEPTVRMHDGDHRLHEGDVVPFPSGPEGGHQIRNDAAETARVLIVAAHSDPHVAVYPETGKVATIVAGEHTFHRVVDAVEHAGPEG